MPATAGRVRMPPNNRVHSSAALQTHGIWQVAIGYDPYAPTTNKESKAVNDSENAYASFQGLLSLARITGTSSNETRGACKKCGRIGHLTYQCRNFLSLKDDEKPQQNNDSAVQTANVVFEKIKKAASGGKEKEETDSDNDDEDEEISSSDSDVDPEIERIIAERFGKPKSKKVETLSKRSKKRSSSSDDGGDRRKKRRHEHKKRRRSHYHRRRRSDSDDDDESDSDRNRKHKRRRRRREIDSDMSSSESDRNRKRRHKERRSVLSSESESTASSSDEEEIKEKKCSRGHRRV